MDRREIIFEGPHGHIADFVIAVVRACERAHVVSRRGREVAFHVLNSRDSRLRAKGKNESPGDLFVVVDVQLPKKITDEERTLWEKLGEVSGFAPRKAETT
jgi:hypothetical protein